MLSTLTAAVLITMGLAIIAYSAHCRRRRPVLRQVPAHLSRRGTPSVPPAFARCAGCDGSLTSDELMHMTRTAGTPIAWHLRCWTTAQRLPAVHSHIGRTACTCPRCERQRVIAASK